MRCRSCRTQIDERTRRIYYGLCGPCYGKLAARWDEEYYTFDGQMKRWCKEA